MMSLLITFTVFTFFSFITAIIVRWYDCESENKSEDNI